MKLYQFRFLNAAGTVDRRHPLQLPTNLAAVKVGQHMLAKRASAGALEIWHRNRLVHSTH